MFASGPIEIIISVTKLKSPIHQQSPPLHQPDRYTNQVDSTDNLRHTNSSRNHNPVSLDIVLNSPRTE